MYKLSIILLTVLTFSSCAKKMDRINPLDGKTLAFVSTNAFPLSTITSTTAIGGGVIGSDGGLNITEKGLVYGITQNPTIGIAQKINSGTGSTPFTSSLTGLTPNTTYYARAYAINLVGTAYGNQVSFLTQKAAPSITTSAVSVNTFNSFTAGGNISSDNGSPVTVRGIVWSRFQNPTIDLITKTKDSFGVGSFISKATSLEPATQYYFKAYATNSLGTSYGTEVPIVTAANIPSLTTKAIYNVANTSISSGGNIINDGGGAITAKGVVWSTTASPTVTLTTKTNDGTGNASYNSTGISGLTPGVRYYLRAYATNIAGTGYGDEILFTTVPIIPSLTTSEAKNVKTTTAEVTGTLLDDGGAFLNDFGFVWGTNPNPPITLVTKAKVGNSTGGFSKNYIYSVQISNLKAGTKYYLRSYGVNSAGVGYGNDVTFNTSGQVPTMNTSTTVTNLKGNSATVSGLVTDNGGTVITSKGVVWNTSSGPTVDLTTKGYDNNLNVDNITVNITGLKAATKYYARTFAYNSIGFDYGNEINFTTVDNLPKVTTTPVDVSIITATSVNLSGNATADNGSAITSKGIVWDIFPNIPNVSYNRINYGTGTGSFSVPLTGLAPGTKYNFAAYAINVNGESYGDVLNFTTLAVKPTVSTTDPSGLAPTSVIIGGDVTNDGGSPIEIKGVIYSLTGGSNLTVALTTKTDNGAGKGTFSSTITGLERSKKYYYVAYAKNAMGITYGPEKTFTTPAN
jgi:hypothetical protein